MAPTTAHDLLIENPARRIRRIPGEDLVHELHSRIQRSWDQLVCRVDRPRTRH